MVTGIAIDPLPLVTAVIHALVTPVSFQRGVREIGPAFPRVIHPFAAVERAALRCAAALRVR